MEAVDLFSPNPAPMVLQDRNLAASVVRFTTLLGWIFPLPHYWRLSGTVQILPDVGQFTALEIVHEIVGHLGGPSVEPEMRRWLAEHFVEFADALKAVAEARRRQMFAAMDAKFGKAVYDLCAPLAECRDHLDALPEVEPDDLSEAEQDEGVAMARVWFDDTAELEETPLPGGQIALGRILLGQSHWRLEALGAERLSVSGGNSKSILATVSAFQASAWKIAARG